MHPSSLCVHASPWQPQKLFKIFKMCSIFFYIILYFSSFFRQTGLCSNCSPKLDEYSLARTFKIFAIARILVFLLKFPAVYSCRGSIICILETKSDAGNTVSRINIGETCVRQEYFWKIVSSFCWRLLNCAPPRGCPPPPPRGSFLERPTILSGPVSHPVSPRKLYGCFAKLPYNIRSR